ncbi:hypothetical protein MGL_0985 [Malassezia globosa CBS 7966]|uniref:LIM zinc-binding domain-containing protein n=1 Tax=Malassezia globosa (strain ATCC MYA-4612 / CBS 7966) TaxID=425265 RepID=A8PVY5_MALGO|nr:uncharacterized protein MGL_0985 [Malassezia globosa CBS 7966]EDP44503.1 hypothetical protein MGL_0985 [Malassezia globosa CBS 7966]
MYHRHCLKCVVCNRRLDSVSLLEHDGEPFCSNCHRTHLGQGKDRFGTAVPLKPKIPILTSQNPPTTSHCKPSQPPPSKANSDTNISARKPLPISPSGSQDPLPIPASLSMQNVVPLHGPPAVGQTPLCGRCQTPVYFAEQKHAANRKWHRACLRCEGCRASLEPNRVEEGPADLWDQGWVNTWCHMCYSKKFGPKGIGVAGMSYPTPPK